MKLAGVNVPVREEEERESRATGIWWQDAANLPAPGAGAKQRKNGVASAASVDEGALRQEAKAIVARAEAVRAGTTTRSHCCERAIRACVLPFVHSRCCSPVVPVSGATL